MRRPKESGEGSTELVPASLVERCKRGDEGAWKELVELTHRDVYSLCLRVLRDPDDAAEATQDAYLKAWRGLKGFRGEAMFTTWLYRVAANAAVSKLRRRTRRWQHETGASDDVDIPAATDTEQEAGARLELRAVEKALAQLPDHYRSAVVLRDVYGFSIDEIAQQQGVSETAAKVRVHRGRRKLKAALYPESE
ncbi:MAG TPA: RNA polymerase sigma factor [Actinomycetota bacterium]|nr:RNA polymerase sigma factor [Actinomycetota bacterium]